MCQWPLSQPRCQRNTWVAVLDVIWFLSRGFFGHYMWGEFNTHLPNCLKLLSDPMASQRVSWSANHDNIIWSVLWNSRTTCQILSHCFWVASIAGLGAGPVWHGADFEKVAVEKTRCSPTWMQSRKTLLWNNLFEQSCLCFLCCRTSAL